MSVKMQSLRRNVKLEVAHGGLSAALSTCRPFTLLCSLAVPRQLAKRALNRLLNKRLSRLCFIAALEQHNKYFTQQRTGLVKAARLKRMLPGFRFYC